MRVKFVLFAAVFAALSLFHSRAYAQVYSKGLIDKSVAVVGNEHILLSQLEEQVQLMLANGGPMQEEKLMRCRILEQMLQQKLFLNQARLDSLTVRSEYVEVEINERLDQIMYRMGGQKETEAYFKKPLFRIKEDWRALYNEQNLIQQAQQQLVSGIAQLTPSEVRKFYKTVSKDSLPVIPIQYKISQIVLHPSKEDAAIAVKERLLEFRQRILNGEKFSSLAALYSEDQGSALRGGELGMAPRAMYWPAFSDAAMALKEGQISQIVETPDGFHIIQMVEKDGDMFNARHILLKPKFSAAERSRAFEKLDSIKTAILADSITFAQAALRYSKDTKTLVNGGQVADENTGSLYFEKDRLPPADYNILKDMKVGEISRPFESLDSDIGGQTIYKIVKLDEIIPAHTANIEQDFIAIQNIAAARRQNEVIKEFIEQKQKSTYIRIDELFRDCPFEIKGWIK